MSGPEDHPAKFFAWFAAIVWAIFGVCLTALILGQDGAINPVLGIPLPAGIATYAAISLHRQERRCNRVTPPEGTEIDRQDGS